MDGKEVKIRMSIHPLLKASSQIRNMFINEKELLNLGRLLNALTL